MKVPWNNKVPSRKYKIQNMKYEMLIRSIKYEYEIRIQNTKYEYEYEIWIRTVKYKVYKQVHTYYQVKCIRTS